MEPAYSLHAIQENSVVAVFRTPMINLYSKDLLRAVAFYTMAGFVETFRTPAAGDPVHVELKLADFTLGIATVEAARTAWPQSRSRRAFHRNRLVDRRHGRGCGDANEPRRSNACART